MDYKRKQIEDYFLEWVIDQGSKNNKTIINFLKEYRDISIKNLEDSRWMDYFESIHTQCFEEGYSILEKPEDVVTFLGDKTSEIKEFVENWEKERWGDADEKNIASDLNDPITLINRYVFIIGEDIVEEWMKDPNKIS